MASPETVWEVGSFRSHRSGPRVLFGRMYEDVARVEEPLFPKGCRVFSIASAGCTAIHLASTRDVTAVDINPTQLEYAQRRAKGGQAETGSAERVMEFGRRLLPLAGWSGAAVDAFLRLNNPNEQIRFWKERLDTSRFRFALNALFSPLLLRRVYSPAFLSFLPERFGEILRLRMERCWGRHPNRENPYARALLVGEPAPSHAAVRIRFVASDAAAFLESCPPASFDAFTLSNILDGAAPSYGIRLAEAIRRAASPKAPVVLRSFAEPVDPAAAGLVLEDRCPLWGSVAVVPAERFLASCATLEKIP